EVLFLDIVLLFVNYERIHCNRLFSLVGYVLPTKIRRGAGIGITCIDYYHVHIKEQILFYNRVLKKGLTTTTRAKDKLISIVNPTFILGVICWVNPDWNALPICKPY